MDKNTLLGFGLTEEQAGKVMESLNGAYVPKSRFNEINNDLKAARDTIKDRDAQLETLNKAAGDNEALQKQIADLQMANAQKDADMKSLRISTAVDMALTAAKAKNNIAAKALMAEFLSKAELSDDGTIEGLDAEVKRLMEGESTAFLFDTEKAAFKGAAAGQKGDPSNSMTMDRFRTMSPMERHKYSVDHPEEYQKLYSGGNE